ncbi:plasmid partitioning protein RepB [Aureimonas pseudogalii]|uniref:ParB family chromosome partitioning protein n=1 Tax=Aureimonas pseudogalii TaxID=1744844 RepID=A0A7W6H8D6_9HYPH|nr:plasmid partitioning protein RepB [Aureimonas pseudogalii]MBB4000471.1 ParB family chromosome partitioning protein [Aureimonas pseudogalii]
MSKGPRKSILANFASFAAEAKAQAGEAANAGGDALAPAPAAGGAPSAARPATPPAGGMVQRVGASVIGATQRSIAELREERDQLRALVDAGGAREIDASLVDPSHFRDRMPDDDDADFEGFRARFAQEGQKVPAEVRVHPDVPGRFQLVFGHRRWRAARELGVPLRAIVVAKSDVEVAVSQGIENAERQDLTWIERARFAATLEQAGLKAREIRAALGIDDPELARFRLVLRSLPKEVIEAIGRAPKAGRPRWVEMAKLAEEFPARVALVSQTLADVRDASSDGRVQVALSVLRGQPEPSDEPLEIRAADGQLLAQVRLTRGTMQLTAVRSVASEWGVFLREEVPHIAERFEIWKAKRQEE